METKWYVLHTLSGQERKVRDSIVNRAKIEEKADLVLQVVVPTENVAEVKAGKRKVSTRLFFPGYLLVEMSMNEDTWHFVRAIPGVLKFLGDKEPVPLSEEEVSGVLNAMEDKKEKVKPKVRFETGEGVKIVDGPFISFEGEVSEIDPDKGKLRVMVTMFGRSTPVELEYWQVERV